MEKRRINQATNIKTPLVSDNVEEELVRFALRIRYEDLPSNVIRAAITFITDTVAVGIAGINAPLSKELRQSATNWGTSANHGAVVFGEADRFPLASAAFVNAFAIHSQEYDCVHEAAVVHPMATVFSTIFSQASMSEDTSGRDIILATVIGVDIATRLGACVKTPLKFFRPATAGLFGATLAIARLRNFSESQALSALGIALALCSGTMQAHIEGKPTLALQIANAARSAIVSCDLVENGFSGPQKSLTGPFGYLTLFEDEFDLDNVVKDLGVCFNITDVSHKPFPTGRASHGGLDCLQTAMEEGLTADNFESMVLHAPPIIKRLVGRPFKAGASINYSRLCYAYLASRMLLDGDVSLTSFSLEKLTDHRLKNLGERISVVDDGTKNPAAFEPQVLKVVLKDGHKINIQIDAMPASAKRPFTATQQFEKFEKCLNFGLPSVKIEQINELWNDLHNLESLSFNKIIKSILKGTNDDTASTS